MADDITKAVRSYSQHSDEEVIEALQNSRGLVRYAAAALGVTRSAVYQRLRANPEIAAAREEAKQDQLDRSEHALFAAVDKGEAWAIAFHLKCIGQSRGYIERQRVEHSGDEEHPIRLRVGRMSDEELVQKATAITNRLAAIKGNGSHG